MEVRIYDTALDLLGIVDEIKALIWTRRYWDCGEFSLLAPMTERHASLFQIGRIIARRDADEAGQIRYITISRDANGLEQIEVKGRFLTHWIGRRILLERLVVTATTQDILARVVRENLVAPVDARRAIPNLGITTTAQDIAVVSCSGEEGESCLDFCSDRAKLAKIGFKITTDLRAKRHTFTVYKGVDRTSSQSANAPCIFSPDFDNVLSQEFVSSMENRATTVFVGGDAPEDAPRQIVEASEPDAVGLDRIEHFDDSESISRTYTKDGVEHQLTDAEYAALLQSRGVQVLDQKSDYINFTSLIDTHGSLQYRRDYDLGDRVTCRSSRWGVRIDVRITEVAESCEQGKQELEITFGESIPSLGQAMKWR